MSFPTLHRASLLLALSVLSTARVSEAATTFTDAAAGLQGVYNSSVAWGDYDNDGDLDLLISNLDASPTLLRNDSVRSGACLTVNLEVAPGSGTALGTRVSITLGKRTLIRDVSSGESYLSAHDPRLHFGLGDAKVLDRLEVRWPDGTRTVRTSVPVQPILTIRK